MKAHLLIIILTIFCFGFTGIPIPAAISDTDTGSAKISSLPDSSGATAEETTFTGESSLYGKLELNKYQLSRQAFAFAIKGLSRLKAQKLVANDSIVTIIDFSLPSTCKRLFILNLRSGELLFNTLVSHGKNSGKVLASHFSNKPNSLQSSLGFYITDDTYFGEHGFSLRLRGIEKGINDNAFDRGIVMHCADYVDPSLINKQGYIGRSWGCPAIPPQLNEQIITTIKNGSCLFIYSKDRSYQSRSKMLG